MFVWEPFRHVLRCFDAWILLSVIRCPRFVVRVVHASCWYSHEGIQRPSLVCVAGCEVCVAHFHDTHVVHNSSTMIQGNLLLEARVAHEDGSFIIVDSSPTSPIMRVTITFGEGGVVVKDAVLEGLDAYKTNQSLAGVRAPT